MNINFLKKKIRVTNLDNQLKLFKVYKYLAIKRAIRFSDFLVGKINKMSAHIQLIYYTKLNIIRENLANIKNGALDLALTIIGIIIASFIIHQSSGQLINVSNELFYACAGIIGTILALTFSLSSLPIQKATESYGNIISAIYKKDKTFNAIFASLSIFCLISIAFGVFSNLNKYMLSLNVWFLSNEIVMLAALYLPHCSDHGT